MESRARRCSEFLEYEIYWSFFDGGCQFLGSASLPAAMLKAIEQNWTPRDSEGNAILFSGPRQMLLVSPVNERLEVFASTLDQQGLNCIAQKLSVQFTGTVTPDESPDE